MTLVSRLERDAHLATQTHSPADALLRHAVDLSHHNTMALTCSADTVITLHDEVQVFGKPESWLRSIRVGGDIEGPETNAVLVVAVRNVSFRVNGSPTR